jgi:hypothetical protein
LESFFQPLRNEQTKRHPACCWTLQLP